MANGTGNRQLYYWIGAAGLLVIGALAFLPKMLGKTNVVVPAGGAAAMPPTPAVAAALNNKAAVDFGVANSMYGRMPDYNFSGLALEQPSNVMPLGFHLNNVL